jgi:hypothetical protein
MKKLIILFSFILLGATVPPEQLTTQDVFEFKGLTKAQIFKKSQEWIATSFQSYKAVTEYTDKEEGTIIANIVVSGTSIHGYHYSGSVKIECKDGKVRLTIIPRETIVQRGDKYPIVDSNKGDALESFKPIKASYIDFMTTKAKEKDKDW